MSFGSVFMALWLIRNREPFYLLCGGAGLTYAATITGLALPDRSIASSTLLCVGLGAYNSYLLAAVRSFEGRRILNAWTVTPAITSVAAFAIVAYWPGGDIATARVANSIALGMSTLAVGVFLIRVQGSVAPRSHRLLGIIQLAYTPSYMVSVGLDLSGDIGGDWLALIPLLSDQVLLGVLNIAMLAMPGEQAEGALRDAALRDPMTGAWNRAGLAQIEKTLELPATVILMDVDHFKQVNDRNGHAAGDAVLMALAHGAMAALPSAAHLIRMGGDEFAAILPGTVDQLAGRRIAETLRSLRLPVAWCTISLGLASTLVGETEIKGAIARADAMLYRAKGDGRNRLYL